MIVLFTRITATKIHQTEVATIIDAFDQDQEIIDTSIFGYLQFPGNHQVLIKEGHIKTIIDQNDVALYAPISSAQTVGNIVLFGHNIPSVFSILHVVEEGQEIKLMTREGEFTFFIIEKIIIEDDNFVYVQPRFDDLYMTLITCAANSMKRLVVIGKQFI